MRFNLVKGSKICAKCNARIDRPELAPTEPEVCAECAEPSAVRAFLSDPDNALPVLFGALPVAYLAGIAILWGVA